MYISTPQQDYRTPELEAATRARIQSLADAWGKEEDKDGQQQDEEAGKARAAAMLKVKRREMRASMYFPLADSSLSPNTPQKKPSCRDLAEASPLAHQGRPGWFSNLYHLTGRASKSAYRNAFAIGLRTVMNVFFALLFSAIWHDVKHDQQGIQSFVGLIFMVACNTSFGASFERM
jgi:hypothetical protein